MPNYSSRPLIREDLLSSFVKHNDCGGLIEPDFFYGACVGFECAKCRGKWKRTVVDRFTLRDLQDRFHVYEPASPGSTEVLVWRVDPVTKTRHMATVTLREAHAQKLEKVKI